MKDFFKEQWIGLVLFTILVSTFIFSLYISHNLTVIITFDKTGRVTKIENKTPFNVDVSNLKVMVEKHEK